MSMNLHCNRMELRQTPTQITFMCMVQRNGRVPDKVTGAKAKQALRVYSQWVRFSINGAWKEIDEYLEAKDRVDKELKEINKVIKSRKKLEVYIL